LLTDKKLASKWGPGKWDLLHAEEGEDNPPLLLVVFNSVEHGLRLMETAETRSRRGGPPRFEVVSRKRLGVESELAADAVQRSRSWVEVEPVCATQGWADDRAEMRISSLQRRF